MKMEWTREKTLALINEYRKRRGLWDMTSDDYRKKEIKQQLLTEVSNSIGGGIPIVEIEKKFHTLRTQYHREINRMKRKEPYNSKWFGFKNLQFLSSPKACRTTKGRVKSEITEDGTVTTKYIIREEVQQHDTSGGSGTSQENEYITIHRKPSITYETVNTVNNRVTASTSRSHELEKLIEETTKDVEDIEEIKPKVMIKEITVPTLEHHGYTTQLHTTDLGTDDQNTLQQQQHQQGHMEEDEEHIESIGIQAEDEIAYQSATSTNVGHGQNNLIHNHQQMPRIIKIHRRDGCQDEEFYNEEHQQGQQQQQHHLHSTGATKRLFYDANGHQTNTILGGPTATSTSNNNSSTYVSTTAKMPLQKQQQHQQSTLQNSMQRDEFATYGEYVANEMRGINNREILISLKHKINTAIFEANMAELQK